MRAIPKKEPTTVPEISRAAIRAFASIFIVTYGLTVQNHFASPESRDTDQHGDREKPGAENGGDKIVCSYPITPGSTKLPAPIGVWKIVGIATLPWFRWDEAMLEHGYRSDNYFNIPPGPRNPVGILWMGLNKRGIGIHGTNSPNTIGRGASHGCIRLA